ncbi:MAG: crossover junction endodeoxyribonuclease RuvC [Deltaproteobacteria bacterium]|nr:crossover junction endodeoxyribonuclease RuvC [Deltaproteobacteria bacterium]
MSGPIARRSTTRRAAGKLPVKDSAPSPTIRVLGIDPGTVRMGYGIVEASVERPTVMRYIECGVIAVPARKPRAERLALIGRTLRDIIAEMRPGVVAMEEAFYGENVQSTIALGEARGVALFLAGDAELAIHGYPPATVKSTVAGHGAATKTQIAFMVKAILSMRRPPEADAADALAVGICYLRHAATERSIARTAVRRRA